ncbi:MAG: symmetrical bis(5'-nucleosyl)-tetraphosphatase [Betaproteobacteria bacterium]|nr:symmetrical bis(5'-nucleosyl)-tetraphosphatase [Betaproteobacteria bacterium]
MSTFVVGDLQGCLDPLVRLLDHCGFDAARDRLWCVGDLVNRGPDSLGILRFVRGLGDRATVVLGNHDLHLLVAGGGHAPLHRGDTFQDVLAAPDRDELLDWLRHRPLFHVEGPWALVHAGLLPQWTVEKARALAAEAEALLQSDRCDEFLRSMYGNKPDRWDDDLQGWDRARVIVNAMTRLRVCTPQGVMEFRHKGELEDIPPGYLPWYEVPGRCSRTHTLLFGHWSALGYRIGPDYVALDSGCLWGRSLTALRLEDRRAFHVACRAEAD